MIGVILSRNFWLGLALAGFLGMVGSGVMYLRGYGSGYAQGEADTTALYEAAKETERKRQDDANATARAAQRQRFTNLFDLIDRQDARIEELQNEAEQDPYANELGISADGMRRVNQIR